MFSRVDSRFFSTIALFRNHPFSLGFLEGRIPRMEGFWGTGRGAWGWGRLPRQAAGGSTTPRPRRPRQRRSTDENARDPLWDRSAPSAREGPQVIDPGLINPSHFFRGVFPPKVNPHINQGFIHPGLTLLSHLCSQRHIVISGFLCCVSLLGALQDSRPFCGF